MAAAGLQSHLDAVVYAVDTDALTAGQWAALSHATRSYAGRRLKEACEQLGRALGGLAARPGVAPAEECRCLCGAVHPGRLDVCGGEACTTRPPGRRTGGRGGVPVCGECAQAHDATAAIAG